MNSFNSALSHPSMCLCMCACRACVVQIKFKTKLGIRRAVQNLPQSMHETQHLVVRANGVTICENARVQSGIN